MADQYFYAFSVYGGNEQMEPKCCSRCGFHPTEESAIDSLTWWMKTDPFFNCGVVVRLSWGDDWEMEERGGHVIKWWRRDKDGNVNSVTAPAWVEPPPAEVCGFSVYPWGPQITPPGSV